MTNAKLPPISEDSGGMETRGGGYLFRVIEGEQKELVC